MGLWSKGLERAQTGDPRLEDNDEIELINILKNLGISDMKDAFDKYINNVISNTDTFDAMKEICNSIKSMNIYSYKDIE